jgi:hypothetical protein
MVSSSLGSRATSVLHCPARRDPPQRPLPFVAGCWCKKGDRRSWGGPSGRARVSPATHPARLRLRWLGPTPGTLEHAASRPLHARGRRPFGRAFGLGLPPSGSLRLSPGIPGSCVPVASPGEARVRPLASRLGGRVGGGWCSKTNENKGIMTIFITTPCNYFCIR